ncbi:MAG: LysR family transcriptional regulator [Rhodobacter sp.]|nr:LysR family transcriptional regulator [Paracoccaceae bacterium]MCC0081452.1 LysR family transcriptional regulator [Rhodobacter sp.]
MFNLTQLHHFSLVAQERSFARAAELANISQPALSNSIRSLERRLGLTLFERSERPVRLTSAARGILDRVDAVLFEARNLERYLDNLESGESGHIRIGMTAVFSTSLGGPILADWHRDHPKVKLDLIVNETTALIQRLRAEDLDLIVGDARDLRSDVDDMDLTELPPQPGGAFCRAGHPLLDIAAPGPADLCRYRFAATHFPAAVERAFLRFLGSDAPPSDPVIAIDSHNIAALRDAVAESDLILLTTFGTVRSVLAQGLLRHIPLDLGIQGVWSIATLRGRVPHPALAHMRDKILTVAQRNQAPVPPGTPMRAGA